MAFSGVVWDPFRHARDFDDCRGKRIREVIRERPTAGPVG